MTIRCCTSDLCTERCRLDNNITMQWKLCLHAAHLNRKDVTPTQGKPTKSKPRNDRLLTPILFPPPPFSQVFVPNVQRILFSFVRKYIIFYQDTLRLFVRCLQISPPAMDEKSWPACLDQMRTLLLNRRQRNELNEWNGLDELNELMNLNKTNLDLRFGPGRIADDLEG